MITIAALGAIAIMWLWFATHGGAPVWCCWVFAICSALSAGLTTMQRYFGPKPARPEMPR